MTDIPFPTAGHVRPKEIQRPDGPVSVGPTSGWDGVCPSRYPRPVKLGLRITAGAGQDLPARLAAGTE